MQTPKALSPKRSLSSGSAASHWTAVALPLLVVFASFLGGATQRWSEGIVLGSFALLLLARPPRFSLGPFLNTLALAFIALAAAAFLPSHWFRTLDWRVALTNDFGVQLAPTLSPQPWLSLDCLFTLIAGVAWIYYVATLDADQRTIRVAARVFAGAIIALAALCIFLHLTDRTLPFWHNERRFGPFPNRNQTGDLFGISTLIVLACMRDDFRRDHKRWIIWLIGVGVLIAALILNFSRAGILILVIGVVAWLGQLTLRKLSAAGIAVAVSLLLILCTALLLFGGQTLERFHLRLGSEGTVTADYRWLIFRDVWTMIKSSPWCGFGLGNFEDVFALFRNISRGETRSLHPESDWFWIWTEMGWPALAVILVGLALFVRRIFPLKEGTNQRLRFAALSGTILFLLHGFVDVSGHRLGTFLTGTLFLGLAQYRPLPNEPRRWPPIVFRFVGVLLAAVSISWLVAWRWGLPLPGYLGVARATESATFANRAHQFRDAISFCDRGLRSAPLNWQLYFLRALARIGLREPPAHALDDFRRARFLEPNAYQLPFEEGNAWLGSDPILAVTAWRESLRRAGPKSEGLFSQMLSGAALYNPAVYQALHQLAVDQPDLTIAYLDRAAGPEFETALHDLLARDPALETLNSAQKAKLLSLWSERGPLDELVRAVERRPPWLALAWAGIARWHASRREFETAWGLVRQFAPTPPLPSAANAATIPELQQKLYANPNDYAAGYALFKLQFAAGKFADALASVRHFTVQPNAPAYFYFLQAECWAAMENWERAWQSWQDYRSATGLR